MQDTKTHQGLFYAYLLLLLWIPIPMAGKPPMAQMFLVVVICLLSLVTWKKAPQLPDAFHRARPAIFLFAANIVWLLLQIVPLPYSLLASLSPQRAGFFFGDTPPATMTISYFPEQSLHDALLSFAYFQLFVLTLILVNNRRRLYQLLMAFVVFGLCHAMYASFMTLSGIEKTLWLDKTDHIGHATGTFLNRNHLANYLIFCTAAGIGLLLAGIQPMKIKHWRDAIRLFFSWLTSVKGFIRIALVIMVIAMILTHSRMGNSAFLASLTITAFLWLILTKRLTRGFLLLFASLLIIDVYLMGSWFGLDHVVDRLSQTNWHFELRNRVLPGLQDMYLTHWITGTGSGTFYTVWPLHNNVLENKYLNEAHFDYMQFLIEQGIIGFTLLAGIVALALVKTLQTILRSSSSFYQAAGFAILMGLGATAIQATVEYTLQRPATATIFIVFLALPWIISYPPGQRHSEKSSG
jgi:hypothetical protein